MPAVFTSPRIGYASPEDYAGASDPVQAALNSGKNVVFKPGFSYQVPDAGWVIPSGTHVTAYGATFVAPATLANSVFSGDTPTARTPATEYTLTGSSARNARSVTLTSDDAANFSPGDMVLVRDSVYTSGSLRIRRAPNFVESVSGGTVNLRFPLYFAVPSTDGKIGKVTPSSGVVWEGGHFDMSAASTSSLHPAGADMNCIYFQWAKDCLVRDVTASEWPFKIVCFFGGINSHTEGISGYDPTAVTGGKGYVIQFEASVACTAKTSFGRAVRHVVDFTGGCFCSADGVYGVGRTTDTQTCVQLGHGYETVGHTATNVTAIDMQYGANIGNGTFSWDEASINGITTHRCDEGVLVAVSGSSARLENVVCTQSVIRGIAVNAGTSVTINNVVLDGQQTVVSNYALLDCGNASRLYATNVTIRNPADVSSVRIFGSGDYRLRGLDIVQTGAGTRGIFADSITGTVSIEGGAIVANTSGFCSAVWVAGTATGVSVSNMRITSSGASVAGGRGIYVEGASSNSVRIQGNEIAGFQECVRLDSTDNPVISRNILRPEYANGNCIRLAGSGIATAYAQFNTYLQTYLNVISDTQGTPATVVTS